MDDVLDSSLAIHRTESEGSTTSEDRESSLRVFLEKESLGHLSALFPESVSLSYFQALTEDDLEHDYNVIDDKERELLMQSIFKLREEFSADEVSLSTYRIPMSKTPARLKLYNTFRVKFMVAREIFMVT